MKINEAIEYAIECARQHEQLVKWLYELNQYKQLGIIEEFRDTMKKQIPKNPREVLGIYDNTEYECKYCGDEIPKRGRFYNYCPHCGQRLDWKE